jgi:PAS domain S-box-containing protein
VPHNPPPDLKSRVQVKRKVAPGLVHAAKQRAQREQADALRLLHELQMHQVELEMQNHELRRTQAALEESRDRYGALYDHAPVGYLTLDRQGKVLDANLTAGTLLRIERDRLRGAFLSSFMNEDDSRSFRLHRDAVFANGTKQGCDLWIRRADGSTFPARVDSIVAGDARDAGGSPTCCRSVLLDVSDLRRAEDSAQLHEARFREIAERIDDLFYVRAPGGPVSYASPAYERIWGRPAAELAGKPTAWLDTVHPEDRQRVAEAWRRVGDGVPVNDAYRILCPDGSERWVHSRGFPIEGPDGDVVRAVGVVRDITGERKLEEDLRQSQKMEAVGTLASGVAHNLRNVLQAVLAFIRLAQQKGVGADRAHEALERAAATARRGADLTDQMMVFGRQQDRDVKPVQVDGVVRGAAALIKTLVGEQIALVVNTGAPSAVTMIDPLQLEQILLNLAANARDAMPAGGTLTITTEEARPASGPAVTLTVADTGSGIAPATVRRIFEPFFTTKEVGKGTGLGLATVFALTRQAGGSIDVASELGKGSTFRLSFPSLDCPPISGPVRGGTSGS